MPRTLIVARIAPGSEAEVARIFAESDRTELPSVARVTHRSLYALDDLYVHLFETDQPTERTLSAARAHPEFARVSTRLEPFIAPYRTNWQGPQDAVASCFYTWEGP